MKKRANIKSICIRHTGTQRREIYCMDTNQVVTVYLNKSYRADAKDDRI